MSTIWEFEQLYQEQKDRAEAAEIDRLKYLRALERIGERAQRIRFGEIECTAISAADYDVQVVNDALSRVVA